MYISDLKATINPRLKFIRVYNLPSNLVQITKLNDFLLLQLIIFFIQVMM